MPTVAWRIEVQSDQDYALNTVYAATAASVEELLSDLSNAVENICDDPLIRRALEGDPNP